MGGGSLVGVVVAHCQQRQTVNLQSQVRIRQSPQPTVDCQSLDGLPSGIVPSLQAVLLGAAEGYLYKKTSGQPKKNKKKNIINNICFPVGGGVPVPFLYLYASLTSSKTPSPLQVTTCVMTHANVCLDASIKYAILCYPECNLLMPLQRIPKPLWPYSASPVGYFSANKRSAKRILRDFRQQGLTNCLRQTPAF